MLKYGVLGLGNPPFIQVRAFPVRAPALRLSDFRKWLLSKKKSLPTIFAGINQTIMMALAMVVIASMIGVRGLGVPILQAISNQYLALGLMNGLAIVALAIIFDRVSQRYGKRLQAHRYGKEHE